MRRTPKLEPPRLPPSTRSVVLDIWGRKFVVISGTVAGVYARQLGPDGKLYDSQCLLDISSVQSTGLRFEGDLA